MPAAAARPPVVAVVGATATGKSALAVALAHALDGEVVNGDALQFYRGMDVGTAKVTPAEREGVPHHLLDVLDVGQEASVAAFQSAARDLFDQIRARGRTPILVGGSGLYVRAALDVLEFPPTDPALRAELEARAQREGLAGLRAELAALDPVSAERLQDARRIVRALEVCRLTGRPFSAFMPERTYAPEVAPVVQLGLRLDRAELHRGLSYAGMPVQRIHAMRRTSVMLALGTVMVVSVGAAMITGAPLISASVLFAPLSLLVVVGTLVAGVLLVRAGVDVTAPALRRSVATA